MTTHAHSRIPDEGCSLMSRPDEVCSTRTVLHLRTVTGRGGGPEKTLLNSHRHIGEGYRLVLGYLRPADDAMYDLPARARETGATLIDLPERGPLDRRAWRRLNATIQEIRPAILHTHDYKTDILGCWLGRRHRLPVVTTLHGFADDGAKMRLYYWLGRCAARRMRYVIAVSEALRQMALSWGVRPERCCYIPNGVDCGRYERTMSKCEARRALGLPERGPLVGSVGRLAEEKGFEVLVSAIHATRKQSQTVTLAIAGEGAQRKRLERQAADAGISDRVRFLGHMSDVRLLLQALDLFVLSSRREGMPNVLLEAMASGVPVVATDVGDVSRLVISNQTGCLVPAEDVSALASTIERLVADRQLAETLARGGQNHVAMHYSFAKRMSRVRAVYDEVLDARAHG